MSASKSGLCAVRKIALGGTDGLSHHTASPNYFRSEFVDCFVYGVRSRCWMNIELNLVPRNRPVRRWCPWAETGSGSGRCLGNIGLSKFQRYVTFAIRWCYWLVLDFLVGARVLIKGGGCHR